MLSAKIRKRPSVDRRRRGTFVFSGRMAVVLRNLESWEAACSAVRFVRDGEGLGTRFFLPLVLTHSVSRRDLSCFSGVCAFPDSEGRWTCWGVSTFDGTRLPQSEVVFGEWSVRHEDGLLRLVRDMSGSVDEWWDAAVSENPSWLLSSWNPELVRAVSRLRNRDPSSGERGGDVAGEGP